MTDKKNLITLAAKVIGGIAFMMVFFLNMNVFVSSDKQSTNLELVSSKAYASEETEDGQKWSSTYPECTGSDEVTTETCVGVEPLVVCTSTTVTTPWRGGYRTCVSGSGLCFWDDDECVKGRTS